MIYTEETVKASGADIDIAKDFIKMVYQKNPSYVNREALRKIEKMEKYGCKD